MSDRLVITLPVAPYGELHVGRMSTPILGESIAKSMNCKFIMSINTLDCYKDRDAKKLVNLMGQYNINSDYYWIDSEHINELIDKIYILIKKGYISEKEKEVLCCNCGKVEISTDNLNSINMDDALFEKINDDYYCKFCGTKCLRKKTKSLIFDSKLVDKSTMCFFPDFINKDKYTFDQTVGNNDIIISRNRNTGVIINHNGYNYNLDIDFLWQVFLSLFDEKEKIVICCNHQLYQLYMVGMLEKCFDAKSNTVCLATPFLKNDLSATELENRIVSLKIFDLLVLKWAKKENTFDKTLLSFVNSMNVEKKQLLYDILVEEIETTDDVSDDLRNVLTKKYNFQNSNNELKRRRKNV